MLSTNPLWKNRRTMKTKYLQVFVSVPSIEVARKIADAIMEERLAVCVQSLGPMESVFRWKGHLENISEYLCLLKTVADKYPALEARIKQLHPYEVPEIVAIPIVKGNPQYLKWIDESLI